VVPGVELWDGQWTGKLKGVNEFKGVRGIGRFVVRGIAGHIAGVSLEHLRVQSNWTATVLKLQGVCEVQTGWVLSRSFRAGNGWLGPIQTL
jgi:hypothetical protein